MESSSIPIELREEFKPAMNNENIFFHEPTMVVINAKRGLRPVPVNPLELVSSAQKSLSSVYPPMAWPLQYTAFRRDSEANTITVYPHPTLLRFLTTEPLLVCTDCGVHTFDPRDNESVNAVVPPESSCKHTNFKNCIGVKVDSTRSLYINFREGTQDNAESHDITPQAKTQSNVQSAEYNFFSECGAPYIRATYPPERPINVRHRPSARPTAPNFVRIGTHIILHQPTRLLIHTRTKLELFNPYASKRTLVPVFPRLRQWASLTEWSPIYNQLQDADGSNFVRVTPNKEFVSVLSISEIAVCSKCRKECFKWTVGYDLYKDNTHFKEHTQQCGTGPYDYLLVQGLQTQNVGKPRFVIIEKDGVNTVYEDSTAHRFPHMFEEKKENGTAELHFTADELETLQETEKERSLEITKESSVCPQDSAEASFLKTKVNVLKSDSSFIQIAPEIFFHKSSKLMLRTMVLQKLVAIINPEIGGTYQRMRKEVEKQYRPFIRRAPPPWSSKYHRLSDPSTSNAVIFTPDEPLLDLLKVEKLLLCSSCRQMAYQDKPATKKELPKHRETSPACKEARWIPCRGVATTQMSKAFFVIAGSESG